MTATVTDAGLVFDGFPPLRPQHLIEDVERALIEWAVRQYGTRGTQAFALGISIRTLQAKLKDFRAAQ